MKTLMYPNEMAKALRRQGGKVCSHGSFRLKRHPRSPRHAQLKG